MGMIKKYKIAMALSVAAVACCGIFVGTDVSALAKTPAISKSKTASQLVKQEDGTYKSNIRLSMPADETQLESDVVFVLDKSTSATIETQALEMLQSLKAQVENTDAVVKVGVVIFNKEAHSTEQYFDLATEYGKIEAAIKQEIKSGTNSHAGLLAAKELLAQGKADNSRKYMVFVSDGITYMFGKEPTVVAWTGLVDGSEITWASPSNWDAKYGKGNKTNLTPAEWDAFFAAMPAEQIADTTYDYPYGGTITNATDVADRDTALNSVDKALYLTRATYREICADINCYAVNEEDKNVDHPWGPSFMDYLADGKEVSFADIENDIIYLVDAGSSVTDVMGSGIDNLGAEYNFDFDLEGELYVTVGDVRYDAVKLSDNVYGFGDGVDNRYAYILAYYPEGEGVEDDYFIFQIGDPVKISAPLTLNYGVILTNPSDKVGVHGSYDEDGSEGKAEEGGLSTNNKADLDYVSTDETEGKEQFQRPTVSYEVEAGKGDDGPVVPEKPVEPEIKNPNTIDDSEQNLTKFAIFALGLALSIGYLSFEALASIAAKKDAKLTQSSAVSQTEEE